MKSYSSLKINAFRRSCILALCSMAMTAIGQITQALPYKNVTLSSQSGVAAFQGAALYGKPGQPKLPYYTLTFLLPANADMRNVTVDVENVTEMDVAGVYSVAPALPPRIKSSIIWPAGVTIVNGQDIAVYGNNAFFPASNKGAVTFGQLRQYKLVDVTICPYRFNPVTGALKQLTGGTVVVRGADAVTASYALPAPAPTTVQNSLSRQIAGMVVNGGNLSTYGQAQVQAVAAPAAGAAAATAAAPAAGAAERYLVITTNAIVNASTHLQDFVASKQAKGFTVQVATESTWGGGTGDVAADHIRAYLKSRFLADNIAYVLLIGNPVADTGDVPMKMCWPNTQPSYPFAESDFCFAELSGNWDLNNNGQFGEYYDVGPGGADIYAEVSVGRIPVYDNNIPNLDRILAKTVAYENEPAGEIGWRKNMLLPMVPADADTPAYGLGEAIKNEILVPSGWSYHRIYDDINPFTNLPTEGIAQLNPQPETMPCTDASVLNVWKNKPFGAVVWVTHGWPLGASDIITSPNVSQLNDDYPSFVFQGSCENAMPSFNDNLSYSLLLNGAIGAIGATEVGSYNMGNWYSPGSTYFLTHDDGIAGMAFQFSSYLLGQSLSAGDALNRVKSAIARPIWMNLLCYNLYGDPSLGINSCGTGGQTKQVVFAVNAGGNGYTGSDGVVYAADKNFTGGNAATSSGAIANSNDATLYQSERWGASSYSIPNLASGTYEIRFRFAETYWNSANARKFDVVAEGQTLFPQLDVFAVAGGKNVAYDVTQSIPVTDGTLNISFTNASVDQPKVCAFVVYKLLATNLQPVANAGANQTAINYTVVTLDGRASSDPDNAPQSLTYSWNQLTGPANVTLNGATTAQPTFTPNTAGTYSFRLSVSDGQSTGLGIVWVTVNEAYYTVTTPANPANGGSVSGNGIFTHGVQTPLVPTPNTGYAFSGWSGDISGRANPYQLSVIANTTAVANFVPFTSGVPPVVNAGSNQTVAINTMVTLDGRGTRDPDSGPQPLTFAWVQVGGPITIALTGATTAQPTFTPNVSGIFTFRLTVYDGFATSSADVSITSNELLFTVTTIASPANGGTVSGGGGIVPGSRTYLTATPSAGFQFSGWSGDLSGTLNPYRVSVNSNMTVTANFVSSNLSPVASAGSNQTITINNLVTLDGRASSDPDSGPQPLTYAWSQVSGPATVSLVGASTAQPTFTPNAAGIYTFQLTVSDGQATNSANVPITVNDVLFTVTTSANPAIGGTVSGAGSYTAGSNANLVATPNAGYAFTGWSGDISGMATPYALSVTKNTTAIANFALVTLTKETVSVATASTSESGTYSAAMAIDPSTATRWSSTFSDPQWIMFDMGSAKAIVSVELDWETANAKNYVLEGSNDSAFTAKTLLATKANMATGNHRIDSITGLTGSYRYYRITGTARNTSYGYSIYDARFYSGGIQISYTITATAGANGSISPAGSVKVNQGASQTFGITPNSGYLVASVIVDGISQGAISSYVFANLNGDHSISASFKAAPVTYTLSTASSPTNGGTVTGGGTYSDGAIATLTATPSAGWTFVNWTGDLTGTANPATVAMNTNKNVTAVFTQTGFTIAASAGANGSISPAGSVSVAKAGSQTFTIVANAGYVVDVVTVDGVSQGAVASYTFTNVQGNHSITAAFKTVGVYIPLPSRIQAEDYKAGGEGIGYHDTTLNNTGATYKTDNVDIESTLDQGGGYDVGWTEAGEWLAYDVNVQATGLYNLTARAASGASGAKTMTVTVDGVIVGTFSVSDSSGWQSWKDYVVSNVSLSAGTHLLKINFGSSGINLNYLEVTAGGNLVPNGDFSNGVVGWQTLYMDGAAGTISNDAGAAKIAPAVAGPNPYDIQLYQLISLTANKTYTLEFDMKAVVTPKNFKVVVEHDGGTYTKYHEQQYTVTAAVNTNQHFVITFTPSASDSQVKLGFHFGSFNTSIVWLDNVVLK